MIQLCPKCFGDGHLGRHNSPAISSSTTAPQCDVCFGAKTIIVPDIKNEFPFPKTDAEIKAYGLLLKICKLETEAPSPYGPENESLNRVIKKLKVEYYQLIGIDQVQLEPEFTTALNSLTFKAGKKEFKKKRF